MKTIFQSIKQLNKIIRNENFLIILFFCLISFIVWWPTRYQPFFWDSSGFFVHTTQHILFTKFKDLIAVDTDFAHPTLYPLIMAFFWKVFGPSYYISHLVQLPFLLAGIIALFFWLRSYVKKNLAFVGTISFLVTPVVLAEFFNIYVDLPSACLAIMAITLIRYRHYIWGPILFSLAILTKLPVVTLFPYLFLTTPSEDRKKLLIPIASLLMWITYHYEKTGWLFIIPGRVVSNIAYVSNDIANLAAVLNLFFISQGRWLWTVICLICFGSLIYRKHVMKFNHKIFTVGLTLFLSLFLLALGGEIMNRYLLYILPFFIVLSLICLQEMRLSTVLEIIIAVAMIITPISEWKTAPQKEVSYDFEPPSNVSILDSILVFRQLASYIEIVAPQAKVYGGFPENGMLTEPIQGYVHQSMDFNSCDTFVYNPDILQLVIIHPYSPSQIACRKLLDSQKLLPMFKFESNGKWIELYQVDKPKV